MTRFDCLLSHFPKFHARLNNGDFDPVDPVFVDPPAPPTAEDFDDYLKHMPARLPESYRAFMLCLGGYEFHQENSVRIAFEDPATFDKIPGKVRFALYFLEGDGDQVYFDVTQPDANGDYPVYYFAHDYGDDPRAWRKLADSFVEWIESL